MNEQIRDQYNSLYSTKDIIFGKGLPVTAVTKIREYIIKGSVLDIGGGEGRNAIFLAENGFDVSVYDISEVGIRKLKLIAKNKVLEIKTKVGDIITDGINSNYDAIINTFVLHHMNISDAEKVINESKDRANKGGINIIVTFSNQGDMYERAKKSGRFYPSEKDIRELYSEWNIKELEIFETKTLAKSKNGESMVNSVISLIALKN